MLDCNAISIIVGFLRILADFQGFCGIFYAFLNFLEIFVEFQWIIANIEGFWPLLGGFRCIFEGFLPILKDFWGIFEEFRRILADIEGFRVIKSNLNAINLIYYWWSCLHSNRVVGFLQLSFCVGWSVCWPRPQP